MNKIYKFQAQFTRQQSSAISKMARELKTNKKEVIRKALALLQVAVNERKIGNHIGITKNCVEIKEIVGI